MSTISATDYAILTVLLCAALFSLFLGLKGRAALIAVGKPMAGSTAATADETRGWRQRLNLPALFWRGLLTSRLKKRLAAGLAHGLMFGGALVAIFGHAVFALSFAGVPVYQGRFGFLVMELGRELAGILMFAGVLFFLVRRLMRLERLAVGRMRPGFVAVELLFLLVIVAGFVAEAFRLVDPAVTSRGEFLGLALADGLRHVDAAVHDGGAQAVWWLHGLLGVAFIGLIAHTPLSHMLIGPANSALAHRRSGINLPAIDFDAEPEDGKEFTFGAAKLADLSRKNLLDFSACLWCGRCHEVCPAAQTGKALSPKQVMVTCAGYLGEKRFDDVSLIDAVGMEAVFDCTTCGACVEECPVSNSPAETILEFRRHFVMDRSEMPDTLAMANRNLESRGHPFVGTAANPDDWREGLDVPFFEPGKTEYLLWIGCSVAYEERAQEVARAMLRILDTAGVSYGILEESRCTGDPAKMAGNEMQFVEIAQANIEDFKERQIQKVITMCAHCFNSFDRYYPELGADWQTIPHSVLIDQLIADGRLVVVRDEAEKITFHDPCYLARHNDIVDEPRKALSAVGQLIEMPRNRKESFCCGAGGGNYWGGKGGTARINDVRLQEAIDTGAGKIATSCSFCLLMLTSSESKHGPERRVFDIAELVVAALPGEGARLS
ncbi:(Fe-S)-binding protein [Aromatoleum anaerobium]|uniref:4Fe-4S dicluster domain-containing protein n=1 Tax=Aromatoleum anaerobium TaxID=182180 RepID=A0ABX1PKS8_9RHOO|nr:(Fe-S)-binding protein [Aromatoleum anaerobium]MCK0508112.1 (Fe-S)-binding protein [Aromatoleum anaerobium]